MQPMLVNSAFEMQKKCRDITGTIGFVPTMGYLHEGHLSLVRAARKLCNTVVVSIFVNPSQFSPDEDLALYPQNIDRDVKLLTELEVDHIFFPKEQEMYPEDYKTWVTVDKITQILCGRSRPTHFRGVTTIVTKLINIVNPDYMFMGEKDFQQLVVLQQMAKDLNFRTKIIGCPIVREKDGLAMSSRNKYLSPSARKDALCLHNSLLLSKKLFKQGITPSNKIIAEMSNLIENNNGIVDYIEVVDSQTLEHLAELRTGCRILVAVIIENTRLIDNMEM
jgi:pantoate--beta-alanine ligase